MDNIQRDARLKYSTYGNGKAIIEILNIGFEPLLTPKEYKIYKIILLCWDLSNINIIKIMIFSATCVQCTDGR